MNLYELFEQVPVNEASFADLKKRIPSFLVDEWHEGTGIPKKVLYLYGELGQDQRARPEQVMVQLQPYVSGVLDFCIEHVGDLSNRATPNHGLNWSWGSVKEKAQKTYRTLTHSYGFEREFEENLAANAQYRGLDLVEYKKKVDAGLAQYAAAHAELLKNAHCPLHKNCVRAAVALGKKDFAGAASFLENILRLVKTKESYVNALRDYEPKLNQTLAGEEVLDEAGTKNSDKDRANAWIEKVYARFPYTFNGSSVMVWGDSDNQQFAIFDLVPSPIKVGAVDIKWLQAMPQRQGVGSRALKVLQDMAREDGITLTLRPWSKGKISQSQLTKFYKKQGFKNVSKGDADMVWSP